MLIIANGNDLVVFLSIHISFCVISIGRLRYTEQKRNDEINLIGEKRVHATT